MHYPMTTRITIRKPDDWQLHVRDGAMLRAVMHEPRSQA
jgi:dihydroorotase